jgi:hypothetical protein
LRIATSVTFAVAAGGAMSVDSMAAPPSAAVRRKPARVVP